MAGRSMSTDELRDAVIHNIDDVLESIPEVDIERFDKETFERFPEGTYRLTKCPDAEMLSSKDIYGVKIEIGIHKINGYYLLTITHDLETRLPEYLSVLNGNGMFSLDLHSHPSGGEGSEQPAEGDIFQLGNSRDGRCCIISEKGLKVFSKPKNLPGGFKSYLEAEPAWRYWITQDLKISEEEFEKRGAWNLKREFYEKFFGLRNIPWEQKEEINKILEADDKF